ncbi:MAG: PAS domain S-box protein [Gammaproteobacteria bacterium]
MPLISPKISFRLPAVMIGIVLAAIAATSLQGYWSSLRALESSARNELLALMESRRSALQQYLERVREDLILTARNPMAVEALTTFDAAWSTTTDIEQSIRRTYLETRPGARNQFDGSFYHHAHDRYHPAFRDIARIRGYYDVFLIREDGTILYSVAKEKDFATNLLTGEWKDTHLATLFAALIENPSPGLVRFADFQPYLPSGDVPASFIGAPVLDNNGMALGILAFQLATNRINGVMQVTAGMGETGETYIVGEDTLMRSNSRFSDQPTILKTIVDTETVAAALAGNSGVAITDDYRGVPVYSAHGPMRQFGVTWVIMAEKDEAEVQAPTRKLRNFLIGAGLLLMAATSVIGFAFARWLTRPISEMSNAMRALAGGDLEVPAPAAGRYDEIGVMANAFAAFRENARVRREATERLENADKLQRRLLDAIPYPMAVTNTASGQYLYLNRAGQKRFGIPAEDVRNTKATSVYSRPFEREKVTRAIGDGRLTGLELHFNGADGESFPALVYGQKINFTGEDGWLSVIVDISDVKAAQDRFRALLESAPDGIVVVDSSGTILSANAQTVRLFGYTREELIGRPVEMLMPTRFRANHPAHIGAFFREPEVRPMGQATVLLGLTKSGREFPVEISLSPIQTDEGTVSTAAIRDVTERVETEKELRRAKEDAEQAARAKSAFLATMSHEIRTPMNGVIGMIDLLGQTEMGDDQQDMLRTMRGSAFSLLGIINDILDFSKIEAGKLEIETIPVSIRDVIGGVAETMIAKAAEKKLDLISFVDPEIPAWVLGDEVRLRQVLFNLSGNAVKFTEAGRIIVRADRIGSPAADEVTVRYSVIDQGIGISPEGTAKLFKPFSQAESSTTRRFGGTGLGLSISKSLVDMMGGEIGVESEPGAGSTFTVTLVHEVANADQDTDITGNLEGLNVLVVMRDPDRREFVRRYLEYWQAAVQLTEDFDAIEQIVRQAAGGGKPFEVIVQGMAWSKKERAALRNELRGDPLLERIRFVVLRGDRALANRTDVVDAVTVEGTPLRRESVLAAVAIAGRRVSPEISYEERIADLSRGEAPTVELAELKGELILVAEDNVTNQNVIRRQLGVLGYAADVVENGQEALDALQKKDYATLLTDCNMPVMDGYQLARAVRQTEAGSNRHVPIVAITASILKGDVDRCFDAGMDDYLPKPLEIPKLQAVLSKWMPAVAIPTSEDGRAETGVQNPPGDNDRSPIDMTFLRDCFGDDRDAQRDILQEFAGATPLYLDEIHTALNERSATQVASLAHAFKSAARTIGAHELADLCQSLEYAGKEEKWDEIRNLAPLLAPTMEGVKEFISTF